MSQPFVAVLMGSDSDLPVLETTLDVLDRLLFVHPFYSPNSFFPLSRNTPSCCSFGNIWSPSVSYVHIW